MLSKIIKKKFIQINVEAKDWEDAIKQSADPLLTDKKITKEYVAKIIEISKTTGPYIVITKHVALPHAPAVNGALEPAMGITTLKTPVVSGNTVNDPVKYLFCMSAKENETHLQSMAELIELLSNDGFYTMLDSAEDPEDILSYIIENEKGENHDA